MSSPPLLTLAPPAKKPISILHLILLGGVLAIAISFRVYDLNKAGFWFDEIASVVVACGHWPVIFHLLKGYYEHAPLVASMSARTPLYQVLFEGDSHPPLYMLMLRGWWTIFGMSQGSCRSLSVLCTLLAIPVVFDFTRLLISPAMGLWAALLMAVAPSQIRFAQEARDYAPLIFFGVCACDALLRIFLLGPNRNRYIAFALFSTASMLTHYYAVGGICGIGLFVLLKFDGNTRRNLVITLIAGILVLLAARLPVIFSHMFETGDSVAYLAERRKGLIWRTLYRVATLPMQLIIDPRDEAIPLGILGATLFIFPFVLNRRRPGLMICGCWSVGMVGMVAVSDLVLGHYGLAFVRYTVAAGPMLIVTAVVVADVCGPWVRHTLPAITVIGAVLAIPDTYENEVWLKTETRELAADIKESLAPDDVLVVASRKDMGLYAAGKEYLQIQFYADPIPCAVAIIEGTATDEEREKIWAHHRVWVAQCYYSYDVQPMLGPCRVVKDAFIYARAGKLIRVERLPPSTAPTTALATTP